MRREAGKRESAEWPHRVAHARHDIHRPHILSVFDPHVRGQGEIPEHRGPVRLLTRQPVFDGVKFGEMERDCLLAHGASANLHELLFTLSDSSQMHICRTCSRVANVIQWAAGNGKIRGPYRGFCKSSENTVKINVPYGAKLLYQELFSMGISLKFETELC